jgi:hypothetical protein
LALEQDRIYELHPILSTTKGLQTLNNCKIILHYQLQSTSNNRESHYVSSSLCTYFFCMKIFATLGGLMVSLLATGSMGLAAAGSGVAKDGVF